MVWMNMNIAKYITRRVVFVNICIFGAVAVENKIIKDIHPVISLLFWPLKKSGIFASNKFEYLVFTSKCLFMLMTSMINTNNDENTRKRSI